MKTLTCFILIILFVKKVYQNEDWEIMKIVLKHDE